jgi:hypothetical protein
VGLALVPFIEEASEENMSGWRSVGAAIGRLDGIGS